MSEPASPPSSASYIPYQAYKSKRHSRNLSNSIPNQSPSPVSRPCTGNGVSSTSLQPGRLFVEIEGEPMHVHELSPTDWPTHLPVLLHPPDDPASTILASQTPNPPLQVDKPLDEFRQLGIKNTPEAFHKGNTIASASTPLSGTLAPLAQTSPSARSTPKKISNFRRIPAKNRRLPASIMPDLIPPNHSLNAAPAPPPSSITAVASSDPPNPPTHPLTPHGDTLRQPDQSTAPPTVMKLQALQLTNSSSTNSSFESQTSHKYTPPPARRTAPYPSGFQPKGVYRPLTDDFLALRRAQQDGEGDNGIRRVERTKLERRLEKLIALHFPLDTCSANLSKAISNAGNQNWRASSFFDIQNLNINDASGIWRGMVTGGFDTAKMEVRAAEQRITPWQEDAAVTKCPLCVTTFHPLTNRKHHCRLCGQIICSLPIKPHQRKAPCSTLFIVDAQTREIEEVGEGVDYGVKKHRIPGSQRQQEDSDKFLKGIRICRDCRPTLLRLQHMQQAQVIPPFVDLYDTFINLETSIEESLPKFQELLMTLNHNDKPSKEASAARKRLLDSFAQYDKLSKKIRALPCSNGPGSSQDRVQMAIMTRANIFLQKNMFPLQSLPTPQTRPNDHGNATDNVVDTHRVLLDVDSQLALTLQPLLEQESLLEAFVEEAQSQRKFDDVKTLKANLAEIRHEIDTLLNGSTVKFS